MFLNSSTLAALRFFDAAARHLILELQAGGRRAARNAGGGELLHDGHAWVGANEDAEWRYWLKEAGAGEVDSTQGQFFTLSNLSFEAALAHQGVAMGRACLVHDLLHAGQLVAPFTQRIPSPTKYCLVYPKELADRPGIQAVIRWLHEQTGRFD